MKITVQSSLGEWCGVETGDVDDAGVEWYIDPKTFKGWSDSPSARTDFPERPSAHGTYDTPVWAGARIITIEGKIGGDPFSEDALEEARAHTQALLVSGEVGLLTIDDGHQVLTAHVRRSDRATTTAVGAWAHRFSLQFTAADPVRYGALERINATGLRTRGTGGMVFRGTKNTRTNLSPNPALAANESGWYATAFTGTATAARQTKLTGLDRPQSYRATTTAAGDLFVNSPQIPITPGATITHGITARSLVAATVRAAVEFFDASGNPLDDSSVDLVLAANTAKRQTLTAVAPMAAVTTSISVYRATAAVGDWIEATMHTAETGTSNGTYFDGDSRPGGTWSGTAGSSTSTVATGYPGLAFPLDMGEPGSTDTMSLVNDGTADVVPTFTITGPVTSPGLLNTDTGAQVAYAGDLTAADTLTIIPGDDPVVLLNGQSRYSSMAAVDYEGLVIPARGVLNVRYVAPNSTANNNQTTRATARWRDGWW